MANKGNNFGKPNQITQHYINFVALFYLLLYIAIIKMSIYRTFFTIMSLLCLWCCFW